MALMRNITITVRSTPQNEPNTDVQRDGSGGFAAGEITASGITDDISVQQIEVSKDGALVAARKRINLISGENVELVCTDDCENNEVNIEIRTTAAPVLVSAARAGTAAKTASSALTVPAARAGSPARAE
jgi:hypothetical protein